ncbi:excinuclease ABC subunit UvrC [bacterium]|nr:excinuclease ABC subunit UvrC [bacterium]
MKNNKKTFLDKIPPLPGVYLMKDKKEKIIYVGKAKNLKNRTRSYFVDCPGDIKVQVLAPLVTDIEYIITFNETEALLLEANLIKKHKPVFNVMLKDDKRYPYIKFTIKEKYPVLKLARKKILDGSLYWGPYPHSGNVREIIDVLTGTFKLRTCKKMKKRDRACLNYFIHKCLGACVANTEIESEYRRNCDLIVKLLDGGLNEIIGLFQEKMSGFSRREEFEEAARIRDRIKLLKWLDEKQHVLDLKNREVDIIAYSGNQKVSLMEVFSVRSGSILGKEILRYEGCIEDLTEHIDVLILEYYKNSQLKLPRKIAVPVEFLEGNIEILKNAFFTLHKQKVQFIKPQRGELAKLMKLLKLNVSRDLIRDVEKNRKSNFERIQKEAIKCFEIAHFNHIETVDISNLGVHFPVGAVVVNKNGEFSKSDYRKFKIKNLTDQQNDFEMIKEVIYRKYKRMKEEKIAYPNIVLIDGGKGQLNFANDALVELGIDDICLISIAKEMEEIFKISKSGKISVVNMKEYKKLHLFLIRNRDEVHRFAVKFHRSRRQKSSLRGILDSVNGIGPKRKKMILKKFESLDNILQSGVTGLLEIPGITTEIAEDVIEAIASMKK